MFDFAFLKALSSSFLSLQSSSTMAASKSSSSQSTTLPDECFEALLCKGLRANTKAFVSIYQKGLLQSVGVERVTGFSRFVVLSITGNKQCTRKSQHEHIAVVVRDDKTGFKYTFYFERTASSEIDSSESGGCSSITSLPPTCSLSPVSLSPTSLSPSSSSASSPSSSSLTVFGGKKRETDSPSKEIPLVPLTFDETLDTKTDAASSSKSLALPARVVFKKISKTSLVDKVSLYSTDVLHSSSKSVSSTHRMAEDLIFNEAHYLSKAEVDASQVGLVVSELEPKCLSLFELGILADVVHNFQPEYHLLRGQCYWFIYSILTVVEELHGNHLQDVPNGPRHYLPDLSGRWNGLLISRAGEKDLQEIASRYIKRREEEFAKVNFTKFEVFIFNLNYLKVVEAFKRDKEAEQQVEEALKREKEAEEREKKANETMEGMMVYIKNLEDKLAKSSG